MLSFCFDLIVTFQRDVSQVPEGERSWFVKLTGDWENLYLKGTEKEFTIASFLK